MAGGEDQLNLNHRECHTRYCASLPGYATTFPVDINETELVGDLKKKIKAETTFALANVDAFTLTLYQAALDISYDKKQRINELERLSRNLNECTKLDDVERQLLEVFGEIPQGKKYYTLVQAPEGKSIYCRGIVLMADGVDARPNAVRPPPIVRHRVDP